MNADIPIENSKNWKQRKKMRKYKNRKIRKNNKISTINTVKIPQLSYNNCTDITPIWLNKQLLSEIQFEDPYGYKDMIKKCKKCDDILFYFSNRSEDSNVVCDKCYFSNLI